MKDIKDYLHLYLGCEVTDGENKMKLLSVGLYGYVAANENRRSQGVFDRIKPILRPLSSMTEEEATAIYQMYFQKNYALDFSGDNGSAYFNPKRVKPNIKYALKIIQGIDYETGDFMKVVSIVPYLLSKHFDLFNLIEEGLAIDSTKFNNKPAAQESDTTNDK